MIILSKKRINIILTSILIGILTFSFSNVNSKKDLLPNDTKNQTAVETTATPVSNKVVILDAGHGTPDEGASSKSRVTEAEINLKITLKVQKLLEQSGSIVILTRSDSNGIYSLDSKTLKEKKISDIKNRVKIGNNSSADIFVSIHLNKIPQSQYYGWQCFYKDKNEKSEELAKMLQTNINNTIQKENTRIAMKINNIYIVEHVEIPISIVECGFLSNEKEEQELQTEEYQDRLAIGIYNGILEYFLSND